MRKFIQSRSAWEVMMVCLLAFFATVGFVIAATTIGTNIITGGTMYATSTIVDGASTFKDTVTLSAANLKVSPGYGLDVATSGALNVGTTTATSMNIGSAHMTTTFPGYVSMANASSTNASTTLANFGNGTTISGLLWGTCSVTFASVVASSTAVMDCTSGASTVNATYKVLVTPNASSSMVLVSASSTAGGIQVQFYNTGWGGTPGTATYVGNLLNTFVSLVWMAIK